VLNDAKDFPTNADERLFWGVVPGKVKPAGENMLGKILEKVRNSIVDDSEIEDWLLTSFDLVEGTRKTMPTISMQVFKDD